MNSSAPPATAAPPEAGHQAPSGRFWVLTLGSIGVVYGDIGTSPLYAFRESIVAASAGQAATPAAILGVLSLITWALIVIVTIKYVVLLLRADNDGEGGTLALMALAQRVVKRGHCSWSSASSAARCFTATPSSRRRCRCSRPSKA